MSVFPREAYAYGLECSPDRALAVLAARLQPSWWRAVWQGGLYGRVAANRIRITWFPPFAAGFRRHGHPTTFVGRLSPDRSSLEGAITLSWFERVLLLGAWLLLAYALLFILAMLVSHAWSWGTLNVLGAFLVTTVWFVLGPHVLWALDAEGRDHIEVALQGAARGIGV